jgi:hypothetical protein
MCVSPREDGPRPSAVRVNVIRGAAAPKTDVQVDCGSWIDACPSRMGTCDFTCADTCAFTCKPGCNGI